MKPKHIETKLFPAFGGWQWNVLLQSENGSRSVLFAKRTYTRRSSAQRGAQRAWRRIVKGRA